MPSIAAQCDRRDTCRDNQTAEEGSVKPAGPTVPLQNVTCSVCVVLRGIAAGWQTYGSGAFDATEKLDKDKSLSISALWIDLLEEKAQTLMHTNSEIERQISSTKKPRIIERERTGRAQS